jgi:hypothetical protein
MSAAPMPRATFGTTRKKIVAVLARAQVIYDALLAAAAILGTPPITAAVFLALINAVVTAQQNVTAKVRGAATLRNTLWTAMGVLRSYYQSMADTMTAEGAAALIEAAGLVVGRMPVHHKALFTATLTPTPGMVLLVANATALRGNGASRARITFNWQWSSDGGVTWHDVRSTAYATTDLPGLTLMTNYSFRVSVTIAKVVGPWSQAVSLLVH